MKAKLIKNIVGEYHLIVSKCPDFISISEPITNGFVIALLHNKESDFMRLSLKNCQAIERGYDLDELADEFCKEYDTLPVVRYNTFKAGFETALDLMGDKKFSEKDIKKVIFLCCNYVDSTEETIFESLKQNEWDVEIVMGGYRLNDDGEKIGFPSYELPKLDANGCLILKLKSE